MQELLCSSTGCVTPRRWCEVTEQHGALGFDLSCTFSHTVHSSNPESESLLHAWLHSGIWVNVCHLPQPIVDSFFFLSILWSCSPTASQHSHCLLPSFSDSSDVLFFFSPVSLNVVIFRTLTFRRASLQVQCVESQLALCCSVEQ